MSRITPNQLRKAALAVDQGEEFMCFAVKDASRSNTAWWKFEDMLLEHGVSTAGTLAYRPSHSAMIEMPYVRNTSTPRVKKQERVLFLLFLAEFLERP